MLPEWPVTVTALQPSWDDADAMDDSSDAEGPSGGDQLGSHRTPGAGLVPARDLRWGVGPRVSVDEGGGRREGPGECCSRASPQPWRLGRGGREQPDRHLPPFTSWQTPDSRVSQLASEGRTLVRAWPRSLLLVRQAGYRLPQTRGGW